MEEITEYQRKDRSDHEPRFLEFIPNYLEYPEGSVLVKAGNTWVLCNVTAGDRLPDWLEGEAKGWITAEYNMLPASTSRRRFREGWGGRWPSGRTQEISRIIGRALRGVTLLEHIQGLSFIVDCDVLQADGGTRTTSINGAFVSFIIAIDKLLKQGASITLPVFKDFVGAISVGKLHNNRFLVDLNYEEDSIVEVDLNIVATKNGDIVEIQGTTEKGTLSREEFNRMIDLGLDAIYKIINSYIEVLEKLNIEYKRLFGI